jgi:uroporphyrinogen-III synthase
VKVLVTRPAVQAARTAARLTALGHEALVSPLLCLEPRDWTLPARQPDALIATSANAFAGGIPPDLRTLPLYCVGRRTAEAAVAAGFADARVTGDGTAAGLFAALPRGDARYLYLSGRDISTPPPRDLSIERVVTYEMVPYRLSHDAVTDLERGRIDWVLSYSAASLTRFTEELARAGVDRRGLSAAHLGAADAADRTGWQRFVTADGPTEDALFAAAGLLCEDSGR